MLEKKHVIEEVAPGVTRFVPKYNPRSGKEAAERWRKQPHIKRLRAELDRMKK